jgi:hypothetical protein
MDSTTTLRRLADTLLGEGGLEEYVRTRRLAGRSWRKITLDLRDDIQVDVTYVTLRSWFSDEPWAQSSSKQQQGQAEGAASGRRPGHGRRPGRQRVTAAATSGAKRGPSSEAGSSGDRSVAGVRTGVQMTFD